MALPPTPIETKTNPALFPTVPRREADGSGAKATSDFDTFLTLLTAQLRNQDPTNPLDSTQFVAQLASFSTVEQLVGANERIDTLVAQSTLGDVAGFAGWIGREVAATDGSLRAGGPVAFEVPPVTGAERIEGIVTDAKGKVVDRFTVVADAAGRSVWDGSKLTGDATLTLSYLADDKELARRTALVFRTVTGIRGAEDGAVLDLADGATLATAKVAQLREPATATD